MIISTVGCQSGSGDAYVQTATTVGLNSYAGSATCAGCHESQTLDWSGSHHDLAMQEVSEETVLGDFDLATFSKGEVLTTFFRRDGLFYVNTDGPDGSMQDYKIAYVFGVEPLQQYLIAFPGGRLQALGIAWDSRSIEKGGQRWFHLYPDIEIPSNDPLHWTGRNQNWNYMCADCHSTNLQKGYDPETNRYETTWSEINVGCEACHGAASSHLSWAEEHENESAPDNAEADSRRGFTNSLPDPSSGFRIMNPATGIVEMTRRAHSDNLINTCAPCHSRRSELLDWQHGTAAFLSTHRPAFLNQNLYFADGQIQDEVYVYGSFVQSKMAAAGVICSDCHESHSLKLRAPGNLLCASCHSPERFDTPDHTFHPLNTEGAACVSCHMPERTYMQVDPRRDHRFGIPRPAASEKFGSPDACTTCHSDQDQKWATAQVDKWYGTGTAMGDPADFGHAFLSSRRGDAGSAQLLARIVVNPTLAPIVRGTALAELGRQPSMATVELAATALKSPSPIVRLGALESFEYVPLEQRTEFLLPVLADPVRSVRIEAARLLAGTPLLTLSETHREQLLKASQEYMDTQLFNADRPESWVNIGLFETSRQRLLEAEKAYRTAINLDPTVSAGYVNLADLYRGLQRDDEGLELLTNAVSRLPDDASVNHAYGLALIRRQQPDESIYYLEVAATGAPENPRYAYVLAVALNSAGESEKAIDTLRRSLEMHPNSTDMLFAAATMLRDMGDAAGALDFAQRLQVILPNDQTVGSLVASLSNR